MQPTTRQVRITQRIVEWYLDNYWLSPMDMGTPDMFFDRDLVGEFAVSPTEFEAGEPQALARMLVAVSLFQRLRDQLVLRILRGASSSHVDELTALDRLAKSAESAECSARRDLESLRSKCDLTKDAEGRGVCSRQRRGSCTLHQHTQILKRYGHFGKVPTSLALALAAYGASTLSELYQMTLASHRTRASRAEALEQTLCAAWRVNKKIATMFLSLVATPGLSRRTPPWRAGVAWERFVVVDSNLDEYLRGVGYSGSSSYDSRRSFIIALAARIDLRQYSWQLQRFNPRVVQQAIFAFTGRSNRRANESDCSYSEPPSCRACPRVLSSRCPVRRNT